MKVASFYASPSVSFALDLSTYVLFLIFLSLMAIVGFLPMVEAADVILCIWVGAYVVEELRQVVLAVRVRIPCDGRRDDVLGVRARVL